MIESNGDYTSTAEAQLEQTIGGSLYEKQHTLPLLPVPDLQKNNTVSKLLDTALPLVESEEELHNLLRAAKSFEEDSVVLQTRLLKRREEASNSKTSWLALWWNQMGYLQVRDPIVINVSYFFHLSDDGTLLPAQQQQQQTQSHSLGVMRGAAALVACAEVRKEVCSGTMPHEALGSRNNKNNKSSSTPLCSVPYKYMFHACRIPRLGQDGYRIYDPSLYTHCIVARKGRFFRVDFVNEVTQEPLPLHIIEDQLQQCVEMADMNCNCNYNLQLGWLTSGNRDDWAHAREALLLAGGEKMQKALEDLESGALLLCLDDEEPESRRQCGNVFWHGGHASSGGNRWFDKSVQIFATNNGKLGIMGEHSMMDGMPMIQLADRVASMSYAHAHAKKRSVYGGDGRVSVSELLKSNSGGRAPVDIFGAWAQELQKGYHGDVVSNLTSKGACVLLSYFTRYLIMPSLINWIVTFFESVI